MSDAAPFRYPLREQLAEVRREIAKREGVYPRWVASGKLTKREADEHLAKMRAVGDTLLELVRKEEGLAL